MIYTIGMCSSMWSDADKIWLGGVVAARKSWLTSANVAAVETQIESLTVELENAGIGTRERLVQEVKKGSPSTNFLLDIKKHGIHEHVVKHIFLGVVY